VKPVCRTVSISMRLCLFAFWTVVNGALLALSLGVPLVM
jgi:hypothetical protein